MNPEAQTYYREEFARLVPYLAGADLAWLRHMRAEAMEHFSVVGFPSASQEDWKYTNVATIEKRAFNLGPAAVGAPMDGVSAHQVDALALSADHLLVFVNGAYVPALSRIAHVPRGASVTSLAGALATHAEPVEALLNLRRASVDADHAHSGFSALNAALWSDGAYIDLAPNVEVAGAIHLLFISTVANLASHAHNIIHAGTGARATVIEHYFGMNETAYFTNAVTQIATGHGAVIEHYKLQQESTRAFHIASIDVQQGEGSSFTSHSFALGALLSRNDINTRFNAEGCSATLNGLYMAGGRQHVDHHTRIDHAKPRGTSREYYKGVLDGAARAVFNGKVIVHADAQKSDAYQSNRNLILSESAEVDTKPQLEIYADDVKCAHGATVGQLDPEQVFYLRSRGVDASAAQILLTYAFASEIICRVGVVPLRERLEELLINRLPGGHLVREMS